ncbi:MAG: hypothetical protein RLZZ436_3477 [Planctomycetota bacterium]|jgi:hypothetical protein
MRVMRLLHFALFSIMFCTVLPAVGDEPSSSQPAEPLYHWDFQAAGFSSVSAGLTPAALQGAPQTGVPGPRPPVFPGFPPDNTALLLDGRSWLQFNDSADSQLDVRSGDSLGLEAWVRTSHLADGQQVYLIGKGRTGLPGTLRDNQSWALRLRGMGGSIRVSFLYRSADQPDSPGELHRWNSTAGFAVDDDWHHVAVSFRFGSDQPPVAWIDGEPTDGTWDMGGKTFSRAPYSDDDQFWIGSASGGNPGNTFQGLLDDLRIYRRTLTDAEIQHRAKTTRRTQSLPEVAATELPQSAVFVDIRENVKQSDPWNRERTRITQQWTQSSTALLRLPRKYIPGGLIGDRSNPAIVRMRLQLTTPELQTQLLIRARSAARLLVDGREVLRLTQAPYASDGHQEVPEPPEPLYPTMHPVPAGDQEAVTPIELSAGSHLIEFEAVVGGKNMRVELGETLLAIGSPESGFRLPGFDNTPQLLDEAAWRPFTITEYTRLQELDAAERHRLSADERQYWEQRHARIRELLGPAAAGITSADIDAQLQSTLAKHNLTPLPLVDDATFLRRLALNTVGVIPSPAETQWFLEQPAETRRGLAIDRYLADPRWADHWVSYWQDVLAENPGILKPELNNSGPFRWWIYESFRDHKSTDWFATELVQMKGSRLGGGPAGFAMASQNDVPFAERAIVLATAFGARSLKCARCHDSPVNDFSQQQLFAMAALLNRAPVPVPATSSVPRRPDGSRSPLITVSIEPGTAVDPAWPFAAPATDSAAAAELWNALLRNPSDTREQLALHLTHPTQSNFAKVMVNRLWTRLFGRGLMSDPDDWYGGSSDHAALLEQLAAHHMASGYDLRSSARLIFNSAAWQRETAPEDSPVARRFGAQSLRRMTAEQLLDSLYLAAGKTFDAEMLTLDPEGRRPDDSFLNLGSPSRAWHLCSLSNERDRPALALPVAQSLIDLLAVFGWRDSRPFSATTRDDQATVLQPLTLANGNAGHRLVQLSDNTVLTELALTADSPQQFTAQLFRRVLGREPSAAELQEFSEELSAGFADRVVPGAKPRPPQPNRNSVSWSNHLNAAATRQKHAQEEAARLGDPPTERLTESWRTAAEDVLWVLLNSPEFAFVP